jgi:hypothetical protein
MQRCWSHKAVEEEHAWSMLNIAMCGTAVFVTVTQMSGLVPFEPELP